MTKVLISMSDDVLERIDQEAAARGMSRSGFLREAAMRELGWPDPGRLEVALRRGRAALVDAGSFESADEVRRDRSERDARDRGR